MVPCEAGLQVLDLDVEERGAIPCIAHAQDDRSHANARRQQIAGGQRTCLDPPAPLNPDRMSGCCPDGVDTCDVGLRDDMQDAVGLAHGASGDPAWCNFTRLFAVREHKIAQRQELDLRDAVGAHRRSLVIRPSTQRTAKPTNDNRVEAAYRRAAIFTAR